MTNLCVVQARMASSRLPGKVLRNIGGMPMLAMILHRLQRSATLDAIVVATTASDTDDTVEQVVRGLGFAVIRGSELDVLDRFKTAAEAFPDATTVVRVTADCPFTDPEIVDQIVSVHKKRGLDYTSNRLPPPSPRTYPVGLDVECFSRDLLFTSWREATRQYEREHVTPWMYQDASARVSVLQLPIDLSHHRWTVDDEADLKVVQQLAELVGPEPFGWEDVLAVARAHPEIERLNASVVQKSVAETDARWTE